MMMRERSHTPDKRSRFTVLMTVLLICATGVSAGAQQAPPLVARDYILGVEDVIEVSVWGYADLARTVAIGPDGKVSLPLVGTVVATGMTADRLAQMLKTAYAVYIVNPQVTVIVRDFRKIRVSVLGQVAKPGSYTLPPRSRVLEAISAAGGIVNSVNVKEVRLTAAGGRTQVLQTDALLRSDARHNPQLLGGETIYVPEVNKLSVSVVGQVTRPGSYELLPGARLLDLLSTAGGATENAALREAQLLRPGEQPVVINLEQVLAGDREANVVLRGGETLVIREDLVNIVNVFGEVAKPGRYRLKGEMRLVDVLLLAGGLTEKASVTQARLVRTRESQALNLESLLLRQDMSHNIPLQPGDNLFIPEETNNKIYVLGDVSRPGVFPMKGEVTLLQAIAMAGGPIQRGFGTAKTVHILRRNGTPEPPQIARVAGVRVEPLANGASMVTVDIQALVARGDIGRDVGVVAGDVVVVPQTTIGGFQVVLNILSGIFTIFR
jgi:polysaccharide biosynthesis/export protein